MLSAYRLEMGNESELSKQLLSAQKRSHTSTLWS